MGPTHFYGARAEKLPKKADFAMKQTNMGYGNYGPGKNGPGKNGPGKKGPAYNQPTSEQFCCLLRILESH